MDDYLTDIKKAGLVRWNKTAMPIKVHIEPTSKAVGFRAQFVDILRDAWYEWEKATSSTVPFQFVSTPDRAQIICKWTDNRNDLPASELHCVSAGTLMGILPEGLVSAELRMLTIPTGHPENQSAIPDNVMHQTALHEIGHAFGLTGHSNESTDIMSAFLIPQNQSRSLTERDINTLIALYALDKSEIEKDKYDYAKHANAGGVSLAVAKLNHEAMVAMQKSDYSLAIDKLEQARGLEPNNKLVQHNLGAAYTAAGAKALVTCNMSSASFYLTRALPLWGGMKKMRSSK